MIKVTIECDNVQEANVALEALHQYQDGNVTTPAKPDAPAKEYHVPPTQTQTAAPVTPPATDDDVTPLPPSTMFGEGSGNVPPPQGQAAAPVGDLDKQNCPWDERINTSNKGKTQKGIYKRKPKLDDAYYNQIIAEIKQGGGTPVSPPAQTQHQAPVSPPAQTGGGAAVTFDDVMTLAMTCMQNKQIELSELDEICQRHGVAGGFGQLMGAPNAFASVHTEILQYVNG